MPYPKGRFYSDVKFDIRFDNRFDIKLWNSFYVNHSINFVIPKLRFMVWFNVSAIPILISNQPYKITVRSKMIILIIKVICIKVKPNMQPGSTQEDKKEDK